MCRLSFQEDRDGLSWRGAIRFLDGPLNQNDGGASLFRLMWKTINVVAHFGPVSSLLSSWSLPFSAAVANAVP
jgi:hypothetical protein